MKTMPIDRWEIQVNRRPRKISGWWEPRYWSVLLTGSKKGTQSANWRIASRRSKAGCIHSKGARPDAFIVENLGQVYGIGQSWNIKKKQVTRGHNIFAGIRPLSTPLGPHPTLPYTNKHKKYPKRLFFFCFCFQFPPFQLNHHGWTDGSTDRRTDGQSLL